MANLPLMDTMHHALQAWCIFCRVHPDALGQRRQKGQNAEHSSGSFLSAVPFFLSARGFLSANYIRYVSWIRARCIISSWFPRVNLIFSVLIFFIRSMTGSFSQSMTFSIANNLSLDGNWIRWRSCSNYPFSARKSDVIYVIGIILSIFRKVSQTACSVVK